MSSSESSSDTSDVEQPEEEELAGSSNPKEIHFANSSMMQ